MKFLLIDDHVLIREALQNVLKELACDATILEASDCRGAQILIEQHADSGELPAHAVNQTACPAERALIGSRTPPAGSCLAERRNGEEKAPAVRLGAAGVETVPWRVIRSTTLDFAMLKRFVFRISRHLRYLRLRDSNA
jgi:hypothetical protein